MKKLIIALLSIASISSAFATYKVECSDPKSKIVVKIDSYCPLPISATENAGSKTLTDNQYRTTIKTYNGPKLISTNKYNCYGVFRDDSIFFVTTFSNKENSYTFAVLDDWGMKYASWLDIETDMDYIRLNNCFHR